MIDLDKLAGMRIPALTLTEPWATLVAIGAKRIETRSWQTPYRGVLAIHAAKGMPDWAADTLREPGPIASAVLAAAGIDTMSVTDWDDVAAIPTSRLMRRTRGKVIAVVRLVACVATRDATRTGRLWSPYHGEWLLDGDERAFGDFAPGRYGWVLAEVTRLSEPVPAMGSRGLWDWWVP